MKIIQCCSFETDDEQSLHYEDEFGVVFRYGVTNEKGYIMKMGSMLPFSGVRQ